MVERTTRTLTPSASSTSISPSSLTLATLPIRPPWVTTWSPRRSASTIALCSLSFFCCGRISRKYMMTKIRMSGTNCAKASMGRISMSDGRGDPRELTRNLRFGPRICKARKRRLQRVGIASVRWRAWASRVSRVGCSHDPRKPRPVSTPERPDILGWFGLRQPWLPTVARPLGPLLSVVVILLFALAVTAAGAILLHAIFDLGLGTPRTGFGTGAVIVALLGAPFVIWRAVVAQKTVSVQEQGQITDRINKAVQGLGAEKEVNRLGRSVNISCGAVNGNEAYSRT